MSRWKQATTWDEVCRRASGRRAHNQQRRHVMKARRHQVGALLVEYGPWNRGTQARIAKELRVSPATISRDVEALQLMQSRRRTSEPDPPELASLRASIKLRLAELDQLEQQRSG